MLSSAKSSGRKIGEFTADAIGNVARPVMRVGDFE